MKYPVNKIKKFIPGAILAILVISTTAVLLFLSMDTNDHPIAHISSTSEEVEVGEPIFFDGSGSRDPEGDDLAFTWVINDTMYNHMPSFFYSFPSPGNFTVVLEVQDGMGQTDTETVIIDVRRP